VSDLSVRDALRSDASLVVVEAPAGCGKTTSGADYAREVALAVGPHRLLVLTHTHAACSVFADRTKAVGSRVEIRTIDSVITHIASAYHAGLGLPSDVASWVRERSERHDELARIVAAFLMRYPMIAASLAHRHRVVICDEHQDSSGEQHSIVMALRTQGARLRIFGDPMQTIFEKKARVGSCPPCDWDALTRHEAAAFEKLDFPHRWASTCPALGEWTLAARAALKSGAPIDLQNGLPPSVSVVFAENRSRRHSDYQLDSSERRPIDAFERTQDSLLILTRYNETARSFRGFFRRRLPLWEGHNRPALEQLVEAFAKGQADRTALATAVVAFMGEVGKGFSPSAFGDRFEREVYEGCTRSCKGTSALIQELAQFLVAEADHRGVAKTLRRLAELTKTNEGFAEVQVDCRREFWEAVSLGDFDSPEDGFVEISRRRAYSRPRPPDRAISTIHKAKGLECEGVVVMPWDAKNFPDKTDARCLLYVALSRAKSRLMLVVSRSNPSPLLSL
jgi:hypothetical protein